MLNKLALRLFLGFTLVIISGCSAFIFSDKSCSLDESDAISQFDIQDITDKLAIQLCGSNEETISNFAVGEIVIVPDFVDINTFRPDQYGLIFGEKFRVSINKFCKVPIRQVELNKDFRLNYDGLTALTRNADSIKYPKAVARTALVGTYSLQPNKLSLIAKTISIDNSVITSFATKEIKWRCQVGYDGKQSLIWTTK